jgi:hypothetical protein
MTYRRYSQIETNRFSDVSSVESFARCGVGKLLWRINNTVGELVFSLWMDTWFMADMTHHHRNTQQSVFGALKNTLTLYLIWL